MEKLWNSFFSLGIVHPMMFPDTIRGEGRMLETLGRILEDPTWDLVAIRPPKDPHLKDPMKRMISQAHVQTGFLATMPMMQQNILLSAIDEPNRRAAVERAKELVDEAYFFGSRTMLIASDRDPGPSQRKAAKSAFRRSVVELCRYARDNAVDYVLKLVIENFDRDVEKKFLIGPTAEMVEITREVCQEVPNFGICLDISHLGLLGDTISKIWPIAEPYVVEVHLANYTVQDPQDPLYGDNHPRFGYPGGEHDVSEIASCMKELFDVGYIGKDKREPKPAVLLEVKPTPDELPEMVLAGSKRAFMQAWAAL